MATIKHGGRSGVVVKMGHADTMRWEDGGPDGVEFRRDLYDRALEKASAWGLSGTHGSVEIYASARDGGWTADVLPLGDA